MKKYLIDYRTGAGNKEIEGTLEEAMKIAEEGLAYTQESVYIMEDVGLQWEEVARLPWWGVAAEEDDIVTADFGDFGFYGEWILD